MRRTLIVSLLIVVVASLAPAAVWHPIPQGRPAPDLALSAEDAALIAAGTMFDEDPECPDLTDPNAPPNRYICELLARARYVLGLTTCSEYKQEWTDCQSIPD